MVALGFVEQIAKPTFLKVGFFICESAQGSLLVELQVQQIEGVIIITLPYPEVVRMSRRRSNIEIIANILRIGEKGTGKTKIMYSVNMSYAQMQKYLPFLISHGFIDCVKVGNPVVTYQVTDKGTKLMQSIDTITEMLGFQDDDES